MGPTIHQIDKRLDGVERECAYFNTRLSDEYERLDTRLDRLDNGMDDMRTQLKSIELLVSENKGVKDTRKTFWSAAAILASILVGMGIHDHLFNLLGIK